MKLKTLKDFMNKAKGFQKIINRTINDGIQKNY